jgi:TonB family protein
MMVLAALYGFAMLYFAARLAWGIWSTHAIQRKAEKASLSGAASRIWERCCVVFEQPGAQVAVSPGIAGPVTVGLWRSMLLLPPLFVERVEETDLDAVMAHECAHMQRRDFAKNLLYRMVSLPVAYHPVLWLALARVAESREVVCDAMAAQAVAGGENYARSLLRLASLVTSAAPARTLHAIGIFDANTFERRVMRLTGRRVEMGRRLRAVTVAGCVVVGAATCASALALRMEIAAPGPAAAEHNEKTSTVKVSAGVMAGNVIEQKPPVYPAKAKADNDTVNGPVVLHAIISKEGVVERLEVKQSLRADYDASALDAVREWHYKPYLLNGNPVEVETTITVNFSIQK